LQKFYEMAKGQRAKKPFLQGGDAELTYGELTDQLGKLNRLVEDLALLPGDRVILCSKNHAVLAPLFLGLLDNGIVPVVTDPEMRASEFEYARMSTGAQGCIMDQAALQRCCLVDPGFKVRLKIQKKEKKGNFMKKLLGSNQQKQAQEDSYPGVLDALEGVAAERTVSADDIAYIIMTSGSTSMPKPVPATHGALSDHLATLARQFNYTGQSALLNVLPLHHVDGLIQGPVVSCFSGASWVRPFAFSIQNIEPLLLSLYRYRVSHVITVPTILALVKRFAGQGLGDAFDYDEFQCVISSAGYLNENLWRDFEEAFNVRIANMYGLTETVTGAIYCGPDEQTRRIGSIGKPVDCSAKVVNEEGVEVATTELGELLLKGSNVFTGYLDVEGNEQFLDGWFRTGDVSHFDEDGFVYIDGRIKNIIVCGGENIYPEEIADALAGQSMIEEVSCFGVEHPDWGEILVAALVVAQDYSHEDLANWCGENISPSRIPRDWLILEEIPRGPAGKALIPQLRQLYSENKPSRGDVEAEDVQSIVFDIAAENFHLSVEMLSLESSGENTVGWSSMAHINFTLALEEQLDIRLGTDEIMRITDMRTAVELVTGKLGHI
jgi:long-chain acyl-CoA synthetase